MILNRRYAEFTLYLELDDDGDTSKCPLTCPFRKIDYFKDPNMLCLPDPHVQFCVLHHSVIYTKDNKRSKSCIEKFGA